MEVLIMHIREVLIAILFSITMVLPISTTSDAADDGATAAVHKAVTFYASFDEAVRGDFGKGGLELSTRSEHPTEKGKFIFESDFDDQVFKIAAGKGISGGALEPVD